MNYILILSFIIGLIVGYLWKRRCKPDSKSVSKFYTCPHVNSLHEAYPAMLKSGPILFSPDNVRSLFWVVVPTEKLELWKPQIEKMKMLNELSTTLRSWLDYKTVPREVIEKYKYLPSGFIVFTMDTAEMCKAFSTGTCLFDKDSASLVILKETSESTKDLTFAEPVGQITIDLDNIKTGGWDPSFTFLPARFNGLNGLLNHVEGELLSFKSELSKYN